MSYEEQRPNLAIRRADSFGSLEIYCPEGGRPAPELTGKFTTYRDAEKAIDNHLANKGLISQKKKEKEEIKSIIELDHEKFDDDEADELAINL